MKRASSGQPISPKSKAMVTRFNCSWDQHRQQHQDQQQRQHEEPIVDEHEHADR